MLGDCHPRNNQFVVCQIVIMPHGGWIKINVIYRPICSALVSVSSVPGSPRCQILFEGQN